MYLVMVMNLLYATMLVVVTFIFNRTGQLQALMMEIYVCLITTKWGVLSYCSINFEVEFKFICIYFDLMICC